MAFPVNLTAAVDGVTEIVAAHLNNLEEKVGIDSSGIVTSLDYLLKNPLAVDPGHTHTLGAIPTITASATEVNYLVGVTSGVQAQLNTKASAAGGTLTGDLLVSHTGAASVGVATTDDVAGSEAALEALATDVEVRVAAYPASATGSLLGVTRGGDAYLVASGASLSTLRIGTTTTAGVHLCTDSASRLSITGAGNINFGNYSWNEAGAFSVFGNSTWGAGGTLDVGNTDQQGALTCTLNVYSNFNIVADGMYDVRGFRTSLVINNSDDDLSGNSMLVGSSMYGQLSYVTVARPFDTIDSMTGLYLSVGLDDTVVPVTGTVSNMHGMQLYFHFNDVGGVVTDLYAHKIGHDGEGTITNFYGFYIGTIVATNPWGLYISGSCSNYLGGNTGIGTNVFGTNAAEILAIGQGTAPTTYPADMIQLWSANRGGTAGKNSLHLACEDGTLHVLGDNVGFFTHTPTMPFQIDKNIDVSALVNTDVIRANITMSGANSTGYNWVSGINAYVTNNATESGSGQNAPYGCYCFVENKAQAAGGLYGLIFGTRHNAANTAPYAYGVLGSVDARGGGTLTEAYGAMLGVTAVGASAVITTAYGLSVAATTGTGGVITTAYGVYIGDLQATTGYGLYQVGAGDINYLAGDTGIGINAPDVRLHVKHTTDECRVRIETDKANGIAALRYTNDARTYSTRISPDDVFEVRDVTANLARLRIDTYGNILIGEVVCGTSAVRNLIIGSGTAPSDSPADAVAVWAADRGATATKAGLHIRSEDGTSHVFSDLVGLLTVAPTIQCDVSGKIGFATDNSTYWCQVVRMTAGENITAGQILIASTAENDTVLIAPGDSDMPIGIALEAKNDGDPIWVAVSGIAMVQFKGGVTPTRGYIAYMSDTAGGADCAATLPAAAQHNREIGHVVRSAAAGAVAACILHFN